MCCGREVCLEVKRHVSSHKKSYFIFVSRFYSLSKEIYSNLSLSLHSLTHSDHGRIITLEVMPFEEFEMVFVRINTFVELKSKLSINMASNSLVSFIGKTLFPSQLFNLSRQASISLLYPEGPSVMRIPI
jgi:hypothetical protein